LGSASLPDTIVNFNAAQDVFEFDHGDVAGESVTFVGNQGFSGPAEGIDAEAKLIATATGFNLQLDINGNGTADLVIELQNLQGNLSQSNFHIL
jgi:hypothetical protein